ncbi:hypothetical protein QDT91_29500 (plasmid) [Mycolicibacterium aubagnense]|jgi:hypothetical protein|uniref:hypothetical protein n=1 Tax=Mycolicibacterium aubagnense TaxID=319707 RepID=UPI00244DF62A|nr:hypothetical protein [Mycolicibacterium aubagnense]WGI36154.1 hypothetical protein QDT91_29500 [Mycolicibacterium aubagnense]
MTAQEAEAALTHWRETLESRDQLVRDALDSGVTVNRIYVLTGIARSTLYRIRDGVEPPGRTRWRRGK